MTTTLTRLSEAGTLREASGPGRVLLRIIEAGQGSSGSYSAEVLRQAATDRVFAAGTLTYADHPGRMEEHDRPERSIRDLVGRLAQDAYFQDGALWAEAEVFPHVRTLVESMWDTIGVSIRAAGQIDADGNVTEITEARSVDYVTEAGAGGSVAALIESALSEKRNVGQWVESNLHLSFTEMCDRMAAEGRLTRDERIVLSSAIGDALTAFHEKVDQEAPHLFERDVWDDPESSTTSSADMAEVTAQDTPGSPPGDNAPTGHDRQEAPAMSESTETAPDTGALTEAINQAVADAVAPLRDELTEVRGENAQLREKATRDAALRIVRDELAESDLGQQSRRRIAETVVAGDLPVNDDGELDGDSLRETVREEAKRTRAEIAEAVGHTGAVSGIGDLTERDNDADEEGVKALTESFVAAGYDQETAAVMAAGRA